MIPIRGHITTTAGVVSLRFSLEIMVVRTNTNLVVIKQEGRGICVGSKASTPFLYIVFFCYEIHLEQITSAVEFYNQGTPPFF